MKPKTYFAKPKVDEDTKSNPYRCDKCGGFANVFPANHLHAQYTIPDLTNPARQYCAECFYELVHEDHKAYTAKFENKEPSRKVDIFKDVIKAEDFDESDIPF